MGIFSRLFKNKLAKIDTEETFFNNNPKDQQTDIEYLISIIKKIDELDLINEKTEVIRDLIQNILRGHPQQGGLIKKGTYLYRGVSHLIKPEYLTGLIYPPKEKAPQNRANSEKEPMFYGAINRSIPLHELKVKKGDFLALSKWCFIKDIKLAQVGFTDQNFKELNSKRKVPNWSKFEETGFDNEVQEHIANYISRKFSQDIIKKEVYNLTNAIAEVLIKKKGLDGIIYPTIAGNAASDNIALTKTIFDKGYLKFVNVEWVKILDIVEDDKFLIEELDYSNDIGLDKFIYWKGRPGEYYPDTLPGLYFDDEDGFIIMRDSKGKLIEKQ